MLTLDLDDVMIELEDGAVKHVGPKTTAATVKCYHVESHEARPFGDSQAKLAVADGEGNEVEVALDPERAAALGRDLVEVAAGLGAGVDGDDSGSGIDDSDGSGTGDDD